MCQSLFVVTSNGMGEMDRYTSVFVGNMSWTVQRLKCILAEFLNARVVSYSGHLSSVLETQICSCYGTSRTRDP